MNLTEKITGVMLSGLLIAGAALYFLIPDVSFSENENRMLTQLPGITAESALSGDYGRNVEEYLADQFPGRDGAMRAASDMRRAAGLKEVNAVYLAGDGYLVDRLVDSDMDPEVFAGNLKALDSFAESLREAKPGMQVTVLPVPDKGTVIRELLPEGAPYYDGEKAMAEVKDAMHHGDVLDVTDAFRDAGSMQVYYRTDHHWTTYGAGLAAELYKAQCGAACNGDAPGAAAAEVPELTTVTSEFLGSQYSKVLCSGIEPDHLEIPAAKEPANLSVDTGTDKSGTCYDMSALNHRDKYALFFGGNYARVDVKTGSGGPKLMVIKDSFANSFVPFLLEDYGEIEMVDLRYFTGSLRGEAEKFDPDQVLVIYEMSNLMQDANLLKAGA